MKWIKIKHLNYDDLKIAADFVEMLYQLDIIAADDLANRISVTLTDDFCRDCQECVEECECNKLDEAYLRADYYYDQWKDRQLEDEAAD